MHGGNNGRLSDWWNKEVGCRADNTANAGEVTTVEAKRLAGVLRGRE